MHKTLTPSINQQQRLGNIAEEVFFKLDAFPDTWKCAVDSFFASCECDVCYYYNNYYYYKIYKAHKFKQAWVRDAVAFWDDMIAEIGWQFISAWGRETVTSKVKVNIDLYSLSTQTPLMCSDMDHTVLPANNTISALYSPVAEHHCPLTGIHCAYPRRDGQAELTWVVG